MEQLSRQGGEAYNSPNQSHRPRHMGAVALDAWLARVAACDTEPSLELFIAQYEPEASAADTGSVQLPLPLQWGLDAVPDDLTEQPLTPEDAAATRRILARSVDIFAGRTALFALYGQLDQKVYAAMKTRLHTGIRLPRSAELRSLHGQYAARGAIEACGIAGSGAASRALVARLERKRRHWIGTALRLL